MSIQEIEKLEKSLESYRRSLTFAKEMKNKTRQSKYEYSIRETMLKIKELEKKYPNETKTRLHKINDELITKIEHLKEENEFLIGEFDEPRKTIDRLLNPEKYKPKEPEPEPEPEIILEPELEPVAEPIIEPEPESISIPIPEPEEKISCQYCGKMVNGERGLKVHQSRWCTKINEEVKVFE